MQQNLIPLEFESFEGFPVEIRKVRPSEMWKVDSLGKKFKKYIGFLTLETIREYVEKECVLGAFCRDEIAGFLIYAEYRDRFRIVQLCVNDPFQRTGVAKSLVEHLAANSTTQFVIKLSCRRDFPAHQIWGNLGFLPLDEKPGRSNDGKLLTVWWRKLRDDDELGLWNARSSENKIDVVIDSQIFYDFDSPDTTTSLISKGLLNDFLYDSVLLWITDEVLHEVDRCKEIEKRNHSRDRAKSFNRISYDRDLFQKYKKSLSEVLPYSNKNQKSDVHHIAMVAASEHHVFSTQDQGILRYASEIEGISGVSVVHPTEVIRMVDEETHKERYRPSRISGLNLRWELFSSADFKNLPYQSLQLHGEKRGVLLGELRKFVSYPDEYECRILKSGQNIVGLRVTQRIENCTLNCPFLRICSNEDFEFYWKFVIADLVSTSISENRNRISVQAPGIVSETLDGIFREMGFFRIGDSFTRISLPFVGSRNETLDRIKELDPKLHVGVNSFTCFDLEKVCAPLACDQTNKVLLIPIQPAFAMGLFDRSQSEVDLFGGDPSVLLRLDNVYYRTKSFHNLITSPARILWYVSGKEGATVATSILDEVQIGLPKKLFQKYERYGILEWKDVYKISKFDINREIMVLKFSQTYMFRQKVYLSELRKIFAKHGISESLQSPTPLPFDALRSIYQIAYS